MKNTAITATDIGILLLSLLLFFFMLITGYGMLLGDEIRHLSYLNIYSREPLKTISLTHSIMLQIIGIMCGISSSLFLIYIIQYQPLKPKFNCDILKWGVYISLLTVTLYGGLLRIISNQQGAAILFFFTVLLYLLFSWLETTSSGKTNTLFKNIILFPIYLTLFYTMGLPGWAKIFGSEGVMERYETMFAHSFIAMLPGGTSSMIFLLGLMELSVPILLIISVVKKEFMVSHNKKWLNAALLITCSTFIALCFGLSVLFNFAGASNLVFYALFTFLILISLPSKS
ncbi:hypothetical protein CMT19_16700 [Elizabethkingia anophelis]|nr:hypothetical protein [Elizabethkingia anophelis]